MAKKERVTYAAMRKKALERWIYYQPLLKRLAEWPPNNVPTVDELADNEHKKLLVTAYRDIKEQNFQGGVIDYLCFVSTSYILNLWSKEFRSETFDLEDENVDSIFDLSHENPLIFVPFLIKRFDKLLWENITDARNMARLIFKDISHLLKSPEHMELNEMIVKSRGDLKTSFYSYGTGAYHLVKSLMIVYFHYSVSELNHYDLQERKGFRILLRVNAKLELAREYPDSN